MKCSGNYKLDCQNKATYERQTWDFKKFLPICNECKKYWKTQGVKIRPLTTKKIIENHPKNELPTI